MGDYLRADILSQYVTSWLGCILSNFSEAARVVHLVSSNFYDRYNVVWVWFLITTLGIDDIILVLQQNRLQWHGHVPRSGVWNRGSQAKRRPKKNWREVMEKTVKHVNWTRRMLWIIVDGGSWKRRLDDQNGWVDKFFFWYQPIRVVPDKGPLNNCVCVDT